MTNRENYEKEILKAINAPLVNWFGAILITYLLIFEALRRLWPNWLYKETNTIVFSYRAVIYISAMLPLIIMVMIGGKELKNTLALRAFIVLSVLLLAIAVFMSGGFLDSPFSGVLALYVGSFIILQEDKEFQRLNISLVAVTVVLVVVPYIVLGRFTGSTAVIAWQDTLEATAVRLFISVTLLIITGLVGHSISKRITDLRKSSTAGATQQQGPATVSPSQQSLTH